MQLTVEIKGVENVQRQLAQLTGAQFKSSLVAALNDTAFIARTGMQNKFRTVFDRPTPYTVNSPFVDRATPEKLETLIAPRGKDKGIDPQKFLRAEAEGGPRNDKRSEKALRRIGVLPPGYITAIPRDPFPGSDDGRGNIRGPFMVRLLSYLQAFGEQGYKANMTARGRKRVEKRAKSAAGYQVIGGSVFFVSYGGLRGQHLAPGVWAKSGTGGAVVRPVLMFVRRAQYSRRFDVAALSRELELQSTFERKLRFRIRSELGQ